MPLFPLIPYLYFFPLFHYLLPLILIFHCLCFVPIVHYWQDERKLYFSGCSKKVSSLKWQTFWTLGSKINLGESSFLCFPQIEKELLFSQSQQIISNLTLLTLQGHPPSKLLNNLYHQIRALCTASDSGITMPKQKSTGYTVFFFFFKVTVVRNLMQFYSLWVRNVINEIFFPMKLEIWKQKPTTFQLSGLNTDIYQLAAWPNG